MAKRFKESKDGFKQLKLTSYRLKITKSICEGDEASKENVKSYPRARANRLSSKIKEITAVINLDSDCSDNEVPVEPTRETPQKTEKKTKVISVKKPTPLKTSCEKLEPRCLQRGKLDYIPEITSDAEKAASPNKRATRKVLFANECENVNNNYLSDVADGCSPTKKCRPSESVESSVNIIFSDRITSTAESDLNKADSSTNKAESPTKEVESPTKKAESPTEKVESPTKKAESLTKKVESPTKKVESPTKKAESPTKKVESPTKKAESPTEKVESPTKKGGSLCKQNGYPNKKAEAPTKKAASLCKQNGSTSKKAETPTKNAATPTKEGESPTKKGESPNKKAGSSTKNAGSSTKKALTKKAESSTKKAESASKKAESPTNKAESLTKKAESPTKKAESPSRKSESPTKKAASLCKQNGSPRRNLSLRLRRDIFTDAIEGRTTSEDPVIVSNNSEEIINVNSNEETIKEKNNGEEIINSSLTVDDSLDVIRTQIAEFSDIDLEDYGITERELAEEVALDNGDHRPHSFEESTVEEHLEDSSRISSRNNTPAENLEDCDKTGDENCGVTEIVQETAIGTIRLRVLEDSNFSSVPPGDNVIGRIRLRNLSEIIDTSKFSSEPNTLQSDISMVDLEGLSEDAGGMSELRTIIRHVAACPNLYSVLHDAEKVILKSFFSLKQDYQYVCFKLFLRQPKWYNMVKFLKDINVEMTDAEITEMFTLLKEQLFVETDYSKDPHIELLNNLMREDVKDIFNSFKLRSKVTTKDALVSAILKHCSGQSTLFDKSSADILLDKICDKMGPCVKLLHSFHHIIFRIHLLYSFTSPALFKPHDLYNFMRNVKNRAAILPTYTTDFMPVFCSKGEFFRFSTASEYYNEYINAKEKDDKELMLKIIERVWEEFKDLLKSKSDDALTKPNFLKKFTAGRVYVKTLSLACDDFRTNLNVADWLEFLIRQDQYSLGRRGDWYSRLAIMYNSHLKYDSDLVAQKVIEALVDPHISTIDRYKLSERASAIVKKKTNKPEEEFLEVLRELIIPPPDEIPFPFSCVDAKPASGTATHGKKLYVARNSDGSQDIMDVETVALLHYAGNGYPRGIHIEGGLVITLFALLFWDLIFDFYVPGTFISEIQDVPLDLYSKDFYTNRKYRIDKRLTEIETDWSVEELRGFAREILRSNENKFTHLLSHRIVQETGIIFDAIACIGRSVIAKILGRLVEDFRAYHSGMPDLFVWNADLKKCKFVEVKSENDTLSMTQKLWLNYLRSVGADIEVCHVNSIGSKIKKGRRQ